MRQKSIGKAAARIGGGHVAAGIDGGGESIDAVIGGNAGIAGSEAGAVALRAGPAQVDVADDAQRRGGIGGRRVALRTAGRHLLREQQCQGGADHLNGTATPLNNTSGHVTSAPVLVTRQSATCDSIWFCESSHTQAEGLAARQV